MGLRVYPTRRPTVGGSGGRGMSRGCRFRWRRPSYVPCMWFLYFGLRGRNECANFPELAPRRRRRRAAAENVELVGACGGSFHALSAILFVRLRWGQSVRRPGKATCKRPASEGIETIKPYTSQMQAGCLGGVHVFSSYSVRILFVFSSCFQVVPCATSRQLHRASVGF